MPVWELVFGIVCGMVFGPVFGLGCDSDADRASRPPATGSVADARAVTLTSSRTAVRGAASSEPDPTPAPTDSHDSNPSGGSSADNTPSGRTPKNGDHTEVNDPRSEGEVTSSLTQARDEEGADDMTNDDTDECDRQCVGGDLDGDDLLTPVDRRHGLRPRWSPDDLIALRLPYVIESGSPPNLLRKAASEAFVELSDAAFAETRVRINIRSGYRPFALQCSIFRSEARNLGCAEATRSSARAGFSEHQLGTTADLAIGWQRLTGDRPIDEFLDAHAHEYGWILSYPEGAEESTGYKYEPWHYRYIGREAAQELVRRSADGRRLSTQEYLAKRPGAL